MSGSERTKSTGSKPRGGITRRRGVFLVLVLMVVAIATMATYSFTELMVAYDDSSYLSRDLVQARVNVESAGEMIRTVLAQSKADRDALGGVLNNPQIFQAVPVTAASDVSSASSFTVIAPGLDEMGDVGGIRYGLIDESAKLNLNTLVTLEKYSDILLPAMGMLGEGDTDEMADENLAVSLLKSVPGMTDDIADAILDWIDEDDEPRPLGAEADDYASLPTPYEPANGPLASVEELLLVRGVTPQLLFGADANRNGVLDADEQLRFGATTQTEGVFGWAAYLTVHSAEVNKARDGLPRVNVNQDDLEVLLDELTEAVGEETYATFITAYRMAGQAAEPPIDLSAGPDVEPEDDRGIEEAPIKGIWTADLIENFDLSEGGAVELTQVLDLIDATVTIETDGEPYRVQSPFLGDPISMSVYLPILMDVLTTQTVDVVPGRININECSASLIRGIPLISPEAAEAIIEARGVGSDNDANRNFETWPLAEGILTIDEMRTLLPLVTGGGDVYRAQVVGYFNESGTAHRAELLFDATTANPRLISYRNLSHLGRAFDLAVLGSRAVIE